MKVEIYNCEIDLGINLELIKMRTLAVLKLQPLDERFARDADMSGPLLIALTFGSLLLLVIPLVKMNSLLIARKNTLWIHLWLWSDRNFYNLPHYELIKSSTKSLNA